MRETILQLPYYRWLVFAVTSFGTFMSTLTTSIVNVALPPITAALQTDLATVQWIVTAYLLFITGLLPIAGRLGDLWGRRTLYSLGFLGFTLGCVLCSVSPSIELLIASRLVQAIGASALMANSLAIVTTVFPANERVKALGMVATAVALGQISGPSLGGFLVSGFNWQSIFYVSIILGVLGCIASILILPADQKRLNVNIDYQGAVLFFTGMTGFLLALNNGFKWGYKTFLTLAALSGLAFWAFIRQERRVAFPIVDLSIFKIRPFLMGNILGTLQFMAISANTILLPFFLNDVKQLPLTGIGLLMLVFPFLSAVITPFSGTLSAKTGPGLLTSLGLGFTALGLYFTARLGTDPDIVQIIAGQAVLGFGNALFQPSNNSTVMSAAPLDKLGIASGINALSRNVGLVIGTAMAVAIFEYKRMHSQSALPELTTGAEISSFVGAYHDAMAAAAVAAALGFFISLLSRKDCLKKPSPSQPSQ